MKKSIKKYDLLALGEVLLKLAAPENERLVIFFKNKLAELSLM